MYVRRGLAWYSHGGKNGNCNKAFDEATDRFTVSLEQRIGEVADSLEHARSVAEEDVTEKSLLQKLLGRCHPDRSVPVMMALDGILAGIVEQGTHFRTSCTIGWYIKCTVVKGTTIEIPFILLIARLGLL